MGPCFSFLTGKSKVNGKLVARERLEPVLQVQRSEMPFRGFKLHCSLIELGLEW